MFLNFMLTVNLHLPLAIHSWAKLVNICHNRFKLIKGQFFLTPEKVSNAKKLKLHFNDRGPKRR